MKGRKKNTADKFVTLLIILVVLLFIFVTSFGIYVFIQKKSNIATKTDVTTEFKKDTYLFGDIGVLRAKTADKKPVSIVISPYFEYPANDLAFEEELVKKKVDIRIEMIAWFSVRTLKDLQEMDDIKIKKGLLDAVNKLLIMGKVKEIYFEDYIVLE